MQKDETIHERITQLVNKYGNGKNTVFASLIGSNEANVRGYRTSTMPKFDFLEKIARNIDINLALDRSRFYGKTATKIFFCVISNKQ